MASVSAIRDGLKDRLATIAGLRAHDTAPGSISPPAAVVLPESIAFDSTMARGCDEFLFVVTVLVSTALDRAAQDKLDGYCAGSGGTSVKEAIEGEQTLGGVVHYARVASVRQYGLIEYGGIDYLGAEFTVEVLASGG